MRTNSLAVLGAAIVAVPCGKLAGPETGSAGAARPEHRRPRDLFSGRDGRSLHGANGRLNDGTTENYTTKVIWNSGNQQVLSISSGGLASGKNSGEARPLRRPPEDLAPAST